MTVLTAREHYLVHYILAEKLYSDHHGLWYAFWRMCGPSNPNQSRYTPPSKIYAEAKNKISLIESTRNSGEGNPMFGKTFSESHIQKLRYKRSFRVGVRAPNFGRKFSAEWRKNLGRSQEGSKNNFYGKTHSEETKKLMSERAKERALVSQLGKTKPLIDENGIIYESRKDFMEKTKIGEPKMYALFKENKLKNYVKD